jgi:hypothetical protein
MLTADIRAFKTTKILEMKDEFIIRRHHDPHGLVNISWASYTTCKTTGNSDQRDTGVSAGSSHHG